MKPYTYLIKHTPTNKVYYGYRSANKVEPHNDLWKAYFTSSTYVKDLISQYGIDSFEFEIRKIFAGIRLGSGSINNYSQEAYCSR